MEAIQTAASEALVNVALAVVAALGAYALYFIRIGVERAKAQIVEIKDERIRKALEDALADTDYLAGVVVSALEQTTAGVLRDLVKSGKADRETLLAIGKEAFYKIKDAISPAAQQVITESLGSFDDLVLDLIEQKLGELKAQKALAGS